MTPLFNSLGSNYDDGFVWLATRLALQTVRRSILEWLGILQKSPEADRRAAKLLRHQLEHEYGGQAVLVYKGRDAIEYALRSFGIGRGDLVLTQAFTCHAIEEAIVRTGAQPLFVDLDQKTLNPTPATLDQALERFESMQEPSKSKQIADRPKPRALIVQHTLGLPADISRLSQWCRQHQLLLIEDLAQGLRGTLAGSQGDVMVFSFGRDKILDAVSGGAVVFRQPPSQQVAQLAEPNYRFQIKDLLYPLLSWLVRRTHQYGLGKVILKIARTLNLMQSPILSPTQQMTALPASYASLAWYQWQRLDQQQQHRSYIGNLYQEKMKSLAEKYRYQQLGLRLVRDDQVSASSHNRYPFLIHNPQSLLSSLARHGLFFTDRWYRAAVDAGSTGLRSSYLPGSCPVAEQIANQMVNFPTHAHVTPQVVERIVAACEAWLHEADERDQL